MNRPTGLTLTAVLMALCNVTVFAILKPPYSLTTILEFTTDILVGFAFIWFYWNGRNWARIMVLLYCCGCILNLRLWNKLSPPAPFVFQDTPAHVWLASRAVLSVALLYWLNTRAVREFFSHKAELSSDGSRRHPDIPSA